MPYEIIKWGYVLIFARPSMQFLNNIILQLALHGRGYKNCCDLKSTGEEILLKKVVRHNPSICIDIGANRGHYTEALLRLTNSKVIAFEPLPKAFNSLKEIQQKFPGRLLAINKGVGDKNTELDLYFGEEDSELASFSKEANNIDYVGNRNKNSVRVELITLDSFFTAPQYSDILQIDLLKIDAEGYEYEVLSGAQGILKNKKPKFVQIEYNWHHLFKNHSLFSLASFLQDYVAYQLLPYGSGLTKVDVKRPESNIYCYSNFVFVRRDLTI